jgi:hypothetical protein
MRRLVRVALPILVVVSVLVAVAFAVFRGVTQPTSTAIGISSRHLDIAACWVLFVLLPAACIVDAGLHEQARWIVARRSKFAWIATVAYVPCVGPLLYVTVARPRLA